MRKVLSISTRSRVEFLDVTGRIEEVVKQSQLEVGICWVFVPHTTAGITINEGADPSVRRDIMRQLDKIVPQQGDYDHTEGNSPAHIKASLMGSSVTIMVENRGLSLGTWQSVYLCEFDGPRTRKLVVKVTPG